MSISVIYFGLLPIFNNMVICYFSIVFYFVAKAYCIKLCMGYVNHYSIMILFLLLYYSYVYVYIM